MLSHRSVTYTKAFLFSQKNKTFEPDKTLHKPLNMKKVYSLLNKLTNKNRLGVWKYLSSLKLSLRSYMMKS